MTTVRPDRTIPGGRITIEGPSFSVDRWTTPEVSVGEVLARVVYASPTRLAVLVPVGLEAGPALVLANGRSSIVQVASSFATGLHQVDNPVFDRDGNLYVTYSGTRGQQVPVSIFRVRPDGTRETFCSGIVNPTSMALDADGQLHVSSRFEGAVYRVAPDGSAERFASDLGIACGLAFAPDGTLFVGDRSGTIFRVDRKGHATVFSMLPSSVAAFHLALGPDGFLYVSGPTLASYDAVYRIDTNGSATVVSSAFGRPQGLAFDRAGSLHVIDALAGDSGLYRVPLAGDPELVLSGSGLVGVAFDSRGGLVVCTNDTAYRVPAAE